MTAIAAVVFAAGASRRLGRPKQLVCIDGLSLVRRATLAALDANCRPVSVVVGAHAAAIVAEVADLASRGARTVECADWQEGLSASLRCGVRDVAREQPQAVVLLPCDLPALDAGVLCRLIAAWDGRVDGRVASGYAGTLGTPALFASGLFDRITELKGDRGAQALLRGAVEVPWPEGARDVDTPDDL